MPQCSDRFLGALEYECAAAAAASLITSRPPFSPRCPTGRRAGRASGGTAGAWPPGRTRLQGCNEKGHFQGLTRRLPLKGSPSNKGPPHMRGTRDICCREPLLGLGSNSSFMKNSKRYHIVLTVLLEIIGLGCRCGGQEKPMCMHTIMNDDILK